MFWRRMIFSVRAGRSPECVQQCMLVKNADRAHARYFVTEWRITSDVARGSPQIGTFPVES